MSRSRVEVKREERRMWSNHKRYMRRRGMQPQPKKQYTLRPYNPTPLDHTPIAAVVAAGKKRKVGFFARLWRWIRGKA